MSLPEDQLRTLRKLKKDLLSVEQPSKQFDESASQGSRQGISATQQFLESAPRDGTPLGGLFQRMATAQEGIEIPIDNRWTPLPLNNFDAAAFGTAIRLGQGSKRIAIGMPRVPVGLSTWIAVGIMVARVYLAHDNDQSNSGKWILLAARERVVRDVYLSQRLRFTDQPPIPIAEFPAFRFGRNGEIRAISAAQANKLSSPVLFYHYDPFDTRHLDPRVGRVGLMLAELSESDSRLAASLIERLEDLRKAAGGPKTLLIFNSFDDRQRACLQEMGYELLHVRPPADRSACVIPVPSLAGMFASFSYAQEIIPEILRDDHGISDLLYQATLSLVKASDAVDSPEARGVMSAWWSLWRTLKDLAVPVESYERYRMHAQGRGSLETAIERVASSGDRLLTADAPALRAMAPVVAERLHSVYRALYEHCPKADRLIREIAENRALQDGLIVLGEKSQVEALREHLLFRDVALLDRVPITYLNQTATLARKIHVRELVLPGAWAPWHDSVLLSVGSARIRVLMYGCEASLLLSRLDEHADECKRLAGGAPEQSSLIFRVENSALSTLNELVNARIRASVESQRMAVAPIVREPLDATDEDIELADDTAGKPELAIEFSDGSRITCGRQSELMRLTDDGVESVFASNIVAGDRLAIMPHAVGRSLFHSVLARVRHLIHADPAVVEIWRSSVRCLIFGDERMIARPLPQLIRELHGLGCRRVDVTIRTWFKGTTLAPLKAADIGLVLQLAGVQRPGEVAKIVKREISVIRSFNQQLGRRINQQIMCAVSGNTPPRDRVDFEIDEAIESLEYRTVERVIGAVEKP